MFSAPRDFCSLVSSWETDPHMCLWGFYLLHLLEGFRSLTLVEVKNRGGLTLLETLRQTGTCGYETILIKLDWWLILMNKLFKMKIFTDEHSIISWEQNDVTTLNGKSKWKTEITGWSIMWLSGCGLLLPDAPDELADGVPGDLLPDLDQGNISSWPVCGWTWWRRVHRHITSTRGWSGLRSEEAEGQSTASKSCRLPLDPRGFRSLWDMGPHLLTRAQNRHHIHDTGPGPGPG